jgi:chromosome segregation ATPase
LKEAEDKLKNFQSIFEENKQVILKEKCTDCTNAIKNTLTQQIEIVSLNEKLEEIEIDLEDKNEQIQALKEELEMNKIKVNEINDQKDKDSEREWRFLKMINVKIEHLHKVITMLENETKTKEISLKNMNNIMKNLYRRRKQIAKNYKENDTIKSFNFNINRSININIYHSHSKSNPEHKAKNPQFAPIRTESLSNFKKNNVFNNSINSNIHSPNSQTFHEKNTKSFYVSPFQMRKNEESNEKNTNKETNKKNEEKILFLESENKDLKDEIEKIKKELIDDIAYKENKIQNLVDKISDLEDINYKLTYFNKDKKTFALLEKQVKELTIEFEKVYTENQKLKKREKEKDAKIEEQNQTIKKLEEKIANMNNPELSFANKGFAHKLMDYNIGNYLR